MTTRRRLAKGIDVSTAWIIVVLAVFLAGCEFIDDVTDNYVSPPKVAADEILLLGVTLSPEQRDFPSTEVVAPIREQSPRGEEYVTFKWLDLYFAPENDHMNLSDYSSSGSTRYFPYQFRFAHNENGIRELIPGNELEANDFSNIDYVGSVKVDELPENFIHGGDHILKGALQGIPIRATHIELWFRDSPDATPRIILDVSLDQLFAWRTYIQPLLQSGQ